MLINLHALQKTARKLGINFITLGIIGLMLQSIKNFDMRGIHTLSIVLLIVGVIIWIVGLVDFKKDKK